MISLNDSMTNMNFCDFFVIFALRFLSYYDPRLCYIKLTVSWWAFFWSWVCKILFLFYSSASLISRVWTSTELLIYVVHLHVRLKQFFANCVLLLMLELIDAKTFETDMKHVFICRHEFFPPRHLLMCVKNNWTHANFLIGYTCSLPNYLLCIGFLFPFFCLCFFRSRWFTVHEFMQRGKAASSGGHNS